MLLNCFLSDSNSGFLYWYASVLSDEVRYEIIHLLFLAHILAKRASSLSNLIIWMSVCHVGGEGNVLSFRIV